MIDAVPRCSRQLRASRRCIGHRWEMIMSVLVSYEKIWTEVVTTETGSVRSSKTEKVEAIFHDVPAAAEYVRKLKMQFIPEGVSIWVSPD